MERVNDIDQKFRDIQPSPQYLRDQMVSLSTHGFHRLRERGWAYHMPVLIIGQSAASNEKILKLSGRSALSSPLEYAAVSYC